MVDNCNEFLVDIRNIIYKKDNDIVFSISNSYWKYLKEKAEIMNSKMVTYEKRRKLVNLRIITKIQTIILYGNFL